MRICGESPNDSTRIHAAEASCSVGTTKPSTIGVAQAISAPNAANPESGTGEGGCVRRAGPAKRCLRRAQRSKSTSAITAASMTSAICAAPGRLERLSQVE